MPTDSQCHINSRMHTPQNPRPAPQTSRPSIPGIEVCLWSRGLGSDWQTHSGFWCGDDAIALSVTEPTVSQRTAENSLIVRHIGKTKLADPSSSPWRSCWQARPSSARPLRVRRPCSAVSAAGEFVKPKAPVTPAAFDRARVRIRPASAGPPGRATPRPGTLGSALMSAGCWGSASALHPIPCTKSHLRSESVRQATRAIKTGPAASALEPRGPASRIKTWHRDRRRRLILQQLGGGWNRLRFTIPGRT